MKRIAILAALALVLVLVLAVGVGGAAQAACVATNCAIDEQQRATSPAQGGTFSAGATTPRVEKDLKELSNATQHALTGLCTGGSNCTTQTKSPTPATPCTGNNC
jgi:hypothetical protein